MEFRDRDGFSVAKKVEVINPAISGALTGALFSKIMGERVNQAPNEVARRIAQRVSSLPGFAGATALGGLVGYLYGKRRVEKRYNNKPFRSVYLDDDVAHEISVRSTSDQLSDIAVYGGPAVAGPIIGATLGSKLSGGNPIATIASSALGTAFGNRIGLRLLNDKYRKRLDRA